MNISFVVVSMFKKGGPNIGPVLILSGLRSSALWYLYVAVVWWTSLTCSHLPHNIHLSAKDVILHLIYEEEYEHEKCTIKNPKKTMLSP